MEIRYCRAEDLKPVYDLVCDLEGRILDFDAFGAIYRENIENTRCALLAAVSEGRVVGFLSVLMNRLLHHAATVATIEELVVNEETRGQGIGARLIEEAVRIARENECDTLELTSSLWREDAHRFYERNGFQKGSYKFVMRFNQR